MLRLIDPRHAGNVDIVGIGGRLDVPTLLRAYRQGVFPWPMHNMPLCWFCPPQRAVLDFDRLHVPRRLGRLRRHSPFSFTIDQAFERVIAACRHVSRPEQDGTWITSAVVHGYTKMHQAGFAHSVEAWDAAGQLVGGLYGVCVNGAFAGESMFHLQPNASKLALLFLIDHLAARGVTWMDIQVMTPHMEALGAYLISRDEFLERLDAVRVCNLSLFGYKESEDINMADEFKIIAHTDDITNATPTGEDAARAQEELDALTPSESEPFHIGQEGVVTQTDENPVSDLLGRSDGP